MTHHPILSILEEFNLNANKFKYTSLNSGLINDTYLVSGDAEQQYILQKINHNVFKDPEMLMDNINYTLPSLSAKDYAQITFLSTKDGQNCLVKNGEFWRVMSFIPNSTTYDTTTDTDIAFEAGRIIGGFHGLLKTVDAEVIKDTLPKFHNLAHRTQEFKEALKNAAPEKKEIANNAIQQAHHFLKELEHLNNESLPIRVCHNDTKLNNILFSNATKKALCLIDLDTIMKGYFFYDFGDAIRTVVNNAPEDEQNHDLIHFDKNLFKAFVDGLASNDSFLATADIESLPLGAVFMPFIHGLRALTDYLNNNKYYKVSYENQNLDRCLSLFNFAEKALAKKEFMTDYVQQSLS